MHRPVVDGPGGRVGVPELSLKELTSGRVEAASVGHHGGVLTTQLRVGATGRRSGLDRLICGKQRDLRRAQRKLGDRTQ